jgi:hypothetical protein
VGCFEHVNKIFVDFVKDEKDIESLCHFQPLNKESDPCSCLVESDVFNSIHDVFGLGSVAVFI